MKTVQINELFEKLNSGKKVTVIDVRTPAEHRAINIDGVRNIPVEQIMQHAEELKSKEEVYIFCNSGNRSFMVCEDLALHGLTNLVNVEGGIQAWIQKGHPVNKSKKWSMPIMQQVLAIAGLLIVSAAIAHHFINPNFIWLSAAVGAGLIYAGVTGNCYMGKVLAVLPWNK